MTREADLYAGAFAASASSVTTAAAVLCLRISLFISCAEVLHAEVVLYFDFGRAAAVQSAAQALA